MIPIGLSVQEQQAFNDSLVEDHEMRVRVLILDMDHGVKGELSGRVIDGQVDIDATQDIQRSVSMTILDPENSLGIDTDTPESAGAMASSMVQVFYGVRSQRMRKWVDVPIFTGSITSTDRRGEMVTLTGHSKESILMGPSNFNVSHAKGTRKTRVLSDLLGATGEVRRSIPDLPEQITTASVVASKEAIWPRAKAIAASLAGGYQLVYDGLGVARLVPKTANVSWHYLPGDRGSVLTKPVFAADTAEIKNVIVVTGGTPAGAKARVAAVAHAPASHPFSSTSMGRGGKPRFLREDIEDESITTVQAAQAIASDRLWERLGAASTATFDALVIPHIEPWDRVRLADDGYTTTFTQAKYSIPLTPDGRMTVGHWWTQRTINGRTPARPVNPRTPVAKKVPTPKKSATKTRRAAK